MWTRAGRIGNWIVGVISNVAFIATTGALFVTGVVGGLVATFLDFPWYWRLLTMVGGTGLILGLVVVALNGIRQLMARHRAEEEQVAGVHQTFMHLAPSASVQGLDVRNIAMSITGGEVGESERTPIHLDDSGLDLLRNQMIELSIELAELLAESRRRELGVTATYWARSEFDEDTQNFLGRQQRKKSDEIRAALDATWQANFAGRAMACVLLAADNGFTDEGMKDALRSRADWILRQAAPSSLQSLAEQIRHALLSRRPNPLDEA